MNNKFLLSSVLALSLSSLLGACDRQPSAAIQPAMTSADSFQVAGDYEMHYNALRTDQLSADIARAYGIERSKNKVLLNISVLHKAVGGTPATPTDAAIAVVVRNLNNQLQDIQLRRIAESAATYYIGEVSFSGTETLVFEIKAIPTGTTAPIEATLTREFFAN
jgi:Flp pilus assembly protein TadD